LTEFLKKEKQVAPNLIKGLKEKGNVYIWLEIFD